jgi:toxin ParE1/3/4
VPLRLKYEPEAQADLLALLDFIAADRGQAVAERQIWRITAFCDALTLFPRRGVARDDLRPGLRVAVMQRRVMIAYALVDREIRVLRILSRGRDLAAAFAAPASPLRSRPLRSQSHPSP